MDSGPDLIRRLVLLRHAKSVRSVPEVAGAGSGASRPTADVDRPQADVDRPLARRGVVDAGAAGPALAAVATPDVVLCSPALRTRQTWQLVAAALEDPPAPRYEPVIYGADVPDLLDLIRTVPVTAVTVLVVGHEPTLSATAAALAGPGSHAADLARLRTAYPTSGMAVFRVEGGWGSLRAGGAVLERFAVPRG